MFHTVLCLSQVDSASKISFLTNDKKTPRLLHRLCKTNESPIVSIHIFTVNSTLRHQSVSVRKLIIYICLGKSHMQCQDV